jgi:hypothetical protein
MGMISEERRVKSEKFKSRFPIKGHERKKTEERRAREIILAHGPSPKEQTQILNSSLLTFHSKAGPLQIPTKSLANPIQALIRKGR